MNAFTKFFFVIVYLFHILVFGAFISNEKRSIRDLKKQVISIDENFRILQTKIDIFERKIAINSLQKYNSNFTEIMKLEINTEAQRNTMEAILNSNGYKVWIESNQKNKFYVCFEIEKVRS